MSASELLNDTQEKQISEHLKKIINGGFGELSLIIDRHLIRRIRVAPALHNPDYPPPFWTAPGIELDILLGPWREAFYASLANLMVEGFGQITIRVEYGKVRMILTESSIRARTGQTKPLGPPSSY